MDRPVQLWNSGKPTSICTIPFEVMWFSTITNASWIPHLNCLPFFLFLFSFLCVDHSCDSSWTWTPPTGFLQSCKPLDPSPCKLDMLFLISGSQTCELNVSLCSDTRRPSLCAENEAHLWILRLPIWLLPLPALLFHKDHQSNSLTTIQAIPSRPSSHHLNSHLQLEPEAHPSTTLHHFPQCSSSDGTSHQRGASSLPPPKCI